jgi:hypothetical protein
LHRQNERALTWQRLSKMGALGKVLDGV